MNIESDVVFQRLKAWLLRRTPTASVRRIPSLNASIASDIGFKRTQNQDRVAVVKGQDFNGSSYILIALSDGMGGMIDGEKCAATTIAAFFSSFFKRSSTFGMANDWLEQAAFEANNEVYKAYNGQGGATLSAVLIRQDNRVHWLNVGDSRVYFHREDTLQQVTKDDTIAGQMGDLVSSHAGRNELLQYIGIGKALEPHVTKSVLKENTSIILTSDGVHYLGNDLVQSIITVAQEPGAAAKRLIEVAKYVSGHDNCSAAVIRPDSEIDDLNNLASEQYEIWDPSGEIQILTIPRTPLQKEINIDQGNISKDTETSTLSNTISKKIPRTKRASKKTQIKRTYKENDLLGDEVKPLTSLREENEDPKFRMIFDIKEK